MTSNSATHDIIIRCICLASTTPDNPVCVLAYLAIFACSSRDLQQGINRTLAQNVDFPVYWLPTPLFHHARLFIQSTKSVMVIGASGAVLYRTWR